MEQACGSAARALAALSLACVLLHSGCYSAAYGQSVNLTALKGEELRVYFNVNPPSVTYEDGVYGGYLVKLLETIALEGEPSGVRIKR